ncbi:hypothetical protein [Streptomyces chrestomyceticus]|uniref:Uncharacterized protein n=1 Tax=Streptomyces chrestomyceticus TaxID=68185 RepID=A0ABU7X1G7_9ACTN
MTDATATASAAIPPWLVTAIELYEQQKRTERGDQIKHQESIAATINRRLADLNVVPLRPARVNQWGGLEGALLAPATFDEETEQATYEVRAFWDAASDQVELRTCDWKTQPPVHGRARLLTGLADIAAARNEAPKPPAAPRRDLKAEALRTIGSLDVDRLNNHEVEAIATAIHGLTAAVLRVGDVIETLHGSPEAD